jgi:hypothetical protein
MIKYSQQPSNIRAAITDSYSEERVQEENKNSDSGNNVEVADTDTGDEDGSDNN